MAYSQWRLWLRPSPLLLLMPPLLLPLLLLPLLLLPRLLLPRLLLLLPLAPTLQHPCGASWMPCLPRMAMRSLLMPWRQLLGHTWACQCSSTCRPSLLRLPLPPPLLG